MSEGKAKKTCEILTTNLPYTDSQLEEKWRTQKETLVLTKDTLVKEHIGTPLIRVWKDVIRRYVGNLGIID